MGICCYQLLLVAMDEGSVHSEPVEKEAPPEEKYQKGVNGETGETGGAILSEEVEG